MNPTPKPMPPRLKNQGEPAISSAGQKRFATKFNLLTLGDRFLAAQILQLLTVRIHSAIAKKGSSWAKFWYLLRGLDPAGSGFAKLKLPDVCQILRCSSATVYEWLREGKKIGAFSWYQVRRQSLRVRSVSLKNLCAALALPDFGAVAEISLYQALSQLREVATAATAQKLQQRSRFAAWRSLPAQARKIYKLPQPAEFFGLVATLQNSRITAPVLAAGDIKASLPTENDENIQQLCHEMPKRRTRCVLHVGQKRVFVSKGFIPFGTSQIAIGWERGYCDRTIQRQVKALGVPHRQIVQAKAAYGQIARAIEHDADSCQPEENISWQVRSDRFDGSGVLTDQAGVVGKTHSVLVKPERFFSYGGKDWIYRCNLYEPTFKLCTMRASLREYRKFILQNSLVAGGVTACSGIDLGTKETRRT